MPLFSELKRRNVFKVATAYVIVGWLLMEISTTLLPTFGAPDWIAKVLIFIVALAFVPVLIFAWAFEMTPEGIKREKDVDRDTSITSQTGKKLNYVTIGAVVVGIIFLGFVKTGTDSEQRAETEVVITTGAPSIAVLPFVNMSGNAENEYFSDGLTETLLHMLAQIPELKVAARTSSFAFKGKDADIREIANILEVAHVLEGSVQRAGDRVRITAQLIRADDGFHVWSENYDRTLDDIFGIQDEIAAKVGSALSASLLSGGREIVVGVGTENLKAYDLFLQAISENAKASHGSLQLAEGFLKDALALDPDFHDAKIELAKNYYWQWDTGLQEGSGVVDDAILLVEQVLDEQPDSVRATGLLYTLETKSFLWKGDFQQGMDSLQFLEDHVDSNPGDLDSAAGLVTLLTNFNRSDDALDRQLILIASDPLNPVSHLNLARTYQRLKRYDEARQAALRSLDIEPMQPNAQTLIADVDRAQGDGLGFLKEYLKAIEIDAKDHELPGHVANFLYQLHLPEEADEFRSRVLATAPSSSMAYALNIRHAYEVGDLEAMRRAARKAIEDDVDDRRGGYSTAVQSLVVDALRSDTITEVLEYFDANIPYFAEDDATGDAKYVFARFNVISVWYQILPREVFLQRLDAMLAIVAQIGFDPIDQPLSHAFLLASRGDSKGAADILVNGFFTQPAISIPNWEFDFSDPIMDEVVADPRVQEAIQRWTDEQAAVREDVRAYLAGRD